MRGSPRAHGDDRGPQQPATRIPRTPAAVCFVHQNVAGPPRTGERPPDGRAAAAVVAAPVSGTPSPPRTPHPALTLRLRQRWALPHPPLPPPPAAGANGVDGSAWRPGGRVPSP
eukprot:TRINITY_DN2111_c0_g1_i4.p5 TRINITY_DN2111_c0_g1~~TRINITY_DN2111_c0_g1_i4.p5  ORF type:complete len:114 (-),score=7.21 TRINITY_DN2111_c0_g1_i4:978-1319(-)